MYVHKPKQIQYANLLQWLTRCDVQQWVILRTQTLYTTSKHYCTHEEASYMQATCTQQPQPQPAFEMHPVEGRPRRQRNPPMMFQYSTLGEPSYQPMDPRIAAVQSYSVPPFGLPMTGMPPAGAPLGHMYAHPMMTPSWMWHHGPQVPGVVPILGH